MCTIAFAWQQFAETPIAVAANRDEALDRESLPPRVLAHDPPVVAPQDAEAGGTWLGITDRGLFVAITNRWTERDGAPDVPAERSRGLLVRDALRAADADAAVALVREQVATAEYAGFNLLVADSERAAYLEWDGVLSVTDLDPGVHVVVNPGLNGADDRAMRLRDELAIDDGAGGSTADAAIWLDDAASALGDHEFDVCIHREQFGTRSSSLVTIDVDDCASYAFADGPPCQTDYEAVDLPVDFLQAQR